MAERPVFVPSAHRPFVRQALVQFKWVAGMATSQQQKCIAGLHQAAVEAMVCRTPLEISSKSTEAAGVALSAFNLPCPGPDCPDRCVESAYQGSKVFEPGGPYTDLYRGSGKRSKGDQRLRESGRVVGYRLDGVDYPGKPVTAFYDFIYMRALRGQSELAEAVFERDGFTDIVFNPRKSVNCQAASAATYCGLRQQSLLDEAMGSFEAFLRVVYGKG